MLANLHHISYILTLLTFYEHYMMQLIPTEIHDLHDFHEDYLLASEDIKVKKKKCCININYKS